MLFKKDFQENLFVYKTTLDIGRWTGSPYSKKTHGILDKKVYNFSGKNSSIFTTFVTIFVVKMVPQMFVKFAELLDRTSNTFEHPILAQNRTSNLPNITKNRTVREHRTVRSKTSYLYDLHCVDWDDKNFRVFIWKWIY